VLPSASTPTVSLWSCQAGPSQSIPCSARRESVGRVAARRGGTATAASGCRRRHHRIVSEVAWRDLPLRALRRPGPGRATAAMCADPIVPSTNWGDGWRELPSGSALPLHQGFAERAEVRRQGIRVRHPQRAVAEQATVLPKVARAAAAPGDEKSSVPTRAIWHAFALASSSPGRSGPESAQASRILDPKKVSPVPGGRRPVLL